MQRFRWSLILSATLLTPAVSWADCADLLLVEDFSSLAAWTVIDGGDTTGRAPTWTHLNPGGRSLPGLDEPFAIVDSDHHGFGLMDEQLISPALDAEGNWEWWWAVDDVAVRGTAAEIFADGFESGSTAAWSATVPP